MAIFNRERDTTPAATVPDTAVMKPPASLPPRHAEPRAAAPPSQLSAPPAPDTARESLVAAELTMEGKIEGPGDVRIAGRFIGDVYVGGQLTIESGAHVQGTVHAKQALIAGELTGNIESAARVELLATATLHGDIKAAVVMVAAGARVHGNVAFGWTDDSPPATACASPTPAQETAS